ncbi:MAG TPA: CHASE2 domain-containing protein [Spirochaetota bacterium]|nr:CHASE2 domain-containing protein [Spirochaetota bacterium]
MSREKITELLNKFFETNKFAGIAIGIIAAVIIIPFSFSDLYNQFELKLYDLRMKVKPSIAEWDKLYFINIDDNSTTALGQFPWTRDIYASGLKIMKEIGMSQVSFDIMFPDPSPKQINEEVYKNLMDQAGSRKKISQEEVISVLKNNDAIFSEGIKNNGTAILAYTFSEDQPTPDIIERQKTHAFIEGKKRFESIASIPVPPGREKEFELLAEKETVAIVYPINEMLTSAKNFGFVNRFTDIDGTIRRVRLVQVFDGRIYFNLALSMIIDACGVKKENIIINPDKNIILKNTFNEIKQKYEDIVIPMNKNGMIFVNWAGKGPIETSFHTIPFYALLEYPNFVNGVYEFFDNAGGTEGVQKRFVLESEIEKLSALLAAAKNDDDREKIWQELLKNRKELKKEKLSYLENLITEKKKMESQAGTNPTAEKKKQIDVITEDIKTVELVIRTEDLKNKIGIIGLTATGTSDIASIPLHNEYPGVGTYHNTINTIMQREFIKTPGKAVAFLIIILVALFTGFIVQKLSSRKSLAAAILGFLFINILAFYLFIVHSIWLEQLGINLALLFPSIIIISIKLISEESQKKFIKGAFSRYIAPDVIDQIMLNPESLELGGENRRITIFFSDVAGFSTISEKLSPPELVALLNEYLSEMTDIIISHGGTIDKYEGDAIMAFYGAPQPYIDHELRACKAAIDMKKRLREMQEKWRSVGQHELFVRMGMNTGLAVVGNMGSKMRMDYTAMGDSVNLASRLEGANKWYGTTAMISENTYTNVKDHVDVRKLDTIRVIGKTEPIVIYELFGIKGTLPQKVYDVIELYNKGLEMFGEHQWKKALKFFTDALEILPDDGPSKTYVGRCEDYMKKPPSKNWDGVYSLKSK